LGAPSQRVFLGIFILIAPIPCRNPRTYNAGPRYSCYFCFELPATVHHHAHDRVWQGGRYDDEYFLPGIRKVCNDFKITPAGAFISLYSFCSQVNCADGERPVAGLVRGTDGNLYGTTSGGANEDACFDGCGTIFKITPSGTLTTLYAFCSQRLFPIRYSPLAIRHSPISLRRSHVDRSAQRQVTPRHFQCPGANIEVGG
jgi:uncharacterized repeat protein (TIGR03803 family)